MATRYQCRTARLLMHKDFTSTMVTVEQRTTNVLKSSRGVARFLESLFAACTPKVDINAVCKKGSEDLNGRILFVLADLRERQKSWQGAKDAWAAYAAYLTSHAQAKGFPATAEERIKRIDQRIKDEKDYGAVKVRIKARETERLKEAEENAKKDKLNK